MANHQAETTSPASRTSPTTEIATPPRSIVVRRILLVLATVLVVQSFFMLCTVSANQLLLPRNMPFGVAGPPSPVVSAVASKVGLALTSYPNQSAAMTAIDQGELYGAYVTGSSSDTLIVVPAKSFFAQLEVEPAFLKAAHELGRPVTVQAVNKLPPSDPVGAVTGLLLLPLLVGALLAAVFVFKAAAGKAAAPWRAAILTGYALLGALLTDLIAGLGIGAYSSSHFWPLLPCFWLAATAFVLTAAAIQGVAGRNGTLLVFILFIILGGASSGGFGTYLLPVYWRNIGVILPPQNAVDLMRNVLYFGGNNITTPLIILLLYALGGAAVIGYLGWIRPRRAAAAAAKQAGDAVEPSPAGDPSTAPSRRRGLVVILAALGLTAIMQCLFSTTYMSAGHAPKATNLPFGTTGPSPVLTAAEKTVSLSVTQYPNESAIKNAIDQTTIWGALIPSGTSNTLIVVPSTSDLAPGLLPVRFEDAAKSTGQTLTVQQYAPVKLPPKDPFGIVEGLMMVPLLLAGTLVSALLLSTTGTAAHRWRGAGLAVFALVAGLVMDLVVCYWLQGFPASSFWIVWPICALIIAVVAFVAHVLQSLIGAAGTLLTMIVFIMVGNPASGGANGVPFLPAFWRDIGPYLPPRNAYILLHHTIYFNGNGTTQALTVLLIYLGVGAVILGIFDWLRSGATVPAAAAEGAAMAAPVGAPP